MLPKAQVRVFQFDLALANLDAVLKSGSVTGWLGCAQLFYTMLLLLWPHWPGSMVSVCALLARLLGSVLLLVPVDHKVTPDDCTYWVELPSWWRAFVRSFLADLPTGAVWLFLPDAEKPGTGFHD